MELNVHKKKENKNASNFQFMLHAYYSDCQTELQTELQNLPSIMSCYISNMCTDFKCCVDVSLIKRSFEISLKLDTCRYQLHIEIERLKINVALVDYKFGRYFFAC